MKKSLILIFLMIGRLYAQNSFYAEIKQHKEGDVKLINGQGEIEKKIYIKNDKKFVEAKGIEIGVQQTLTEGENVTFTDNKDCYSDTKSIMREYDSDAKFKNLKQEPSNETAEIAGYECKKMLISFKQMLFNFSVVIWYTDKVDKKYWGTTILTDMIAGHEYHKMLENIGGMILKYELTANVTGQKIITEVKVIKQDEVNDAIFNINTKTCSKILTYKEYQRLLEKRRREESTRNHNYGRGY